MHSNDLLPPGLVVHGANADIMAGFAAIALLQPVAAVDDGVVCAPRAAPELARCGAKACRLPMTPLPSPPGWPDPPSLTAGAWFLRSPAHIRLPAGFRELVQVAGEGFGAWPHPTTLMCLTAIEHLADDAAIDLGCGSGLLSQAWACLRGPVHAIDIDHRAVVHAAASLTHARPRHPISIEQAPLARVLPSTTATTLLANVPPTAHAEILRAMPPTARTVLASGIRTADAPAALAGYADCGFTPAVAASSGGWGCWVLHRG